MTFGEQLDMALKNQVSSVLERCAAGEPLPEPIDFIPDSLGALNDRLIVEHVRVWNIENEIGLAIKRGDKDAVFELKKKMDICWKVIKPKIVAAMNRKYEDAIFHGKSAIEDSVKLYKGYDSPAP